MASISTSRTGLRKLQSTACDGNRKTVRLGKIPRRVADEIKTRVEYLLSSLHDGLPLDAETARWLGALSETLHKKLAAVGLLQPRVAPNLDAWICGFIERRTDVRPSTRRHMKDCKARLIEFFSAQKDLRKITPHDADGFLLFLRKKYADATAGRTVKRAKQFFRAAVRAKMIAENPFADVKPPSEVNEERKHYVGRDVAEAVLEACPDHEWKLIFALSRYGGLRCPSEHLALTIGDLDWERERLRVDSPKTGVRWIPIFPELRPHLEAALEAAPIKAGGAPVINRCRDTKVNLRTRLLRIIKKAGVEPWPKLFHNLRATRQTELEEQFPGHVVCKWLGNSQRVADKHYLQVTDEHFRKATQNATHRTDTPSVAQSDTPQKSRVSGEGVMPRHVAIGGGMPLVGLEPTTR